MMKNLTNIFQLKFSTQFHDYKPRLYVNEGTGVELNIDNAGELELECVLR
jgi:hypothetical protein